MGAALWLKRISVDALGLLIGSMDEAFITSSPSQRVRLMYHLFSFSALEKKEGFSIPLRFIWARCLMIQTLRDAD